MKASITTTDDGTGITECSAQPTAMRAISGHRLNSSTKVLPKGIAIPLQNIYMDVQDRYNGGGGVSSSAANSPNTGLTITAKTTTPNVPKSAKTAALTKTALSRMTTGVVSFANVMVPVLAPATDRWTLAAAPDLQRGCQAISFCAQQ